MVNVFDVAAYILKKQGAMTTWKLQKLVYYCQAWSIVWDEKRLFPEKIEAWANGPVVPKLFKRHQKLFRIYRIPEGDPSRLKKHQRETIDAVLEYYGSKSSQWLSDLTHMEDPWRKARIGIPDNERGNNEITLASMQEYYESLHPHS